MAESKQKPVENTAATNHAAPRRQPPDKKWLLLAAIALLLVFAAGSRYGQYIVADSAAEPLPAVADAGGQSGEAAAVDAVEDGSEAQIAVHVKGAVEQPGLYFFAANARVNDAVLAALPLAEADLNRLNLAAYLLDGGQVVVPYTEAAADTETAGQARQIEQVLSQTGNPGDEAVIGQAADETAEAASASGKININTASAEQLEALPGIGEVKAKAIVSYRELNGAFAYPEQIKRVSGIGEALYLSIAGDICVE